MDIRYSAGPRDVRRYSTKDLREEFLIEKLFKKNKLSMTYSHVDRMVVMGTCPVESLALEAGKELGVSYFLERREMVVVNLAKGKALVTAGSTVYELEELCALYIGRGTEKVLFASASADDPARLYALSCPAHTSHPTRLIRQDEAVTRHLGEQARANKRVVRNYLHEDLLPTCQLAMGITTLEPGSVWNSMPMHTHERRMEVYMYFGLPEDGVVFHLMGEPDETRHLAMHNEQAVISPSWSVHSGCGTASYSFVWGMCGENKAYDDMDHVAMLDIR